MMRRWAFLVLGACVVLGLMSWAIVGVKDSGSTYSPVAVKQVRTLPAGSMIGVIYSSTGQGSDWRRSANGAVIAEYRLTLGGSKVRLVGIDDHGDSAGALDAVDTLVAEGASGIVVASDGAHLDAALEAASAAHVPVVLPYYAPETFPAGVWTTAATQAELSATLVHALPRLKATQPLVIEADGESVPAIATPYRVAYTGGNADEVTAVVASLASLGKINSVVIGGSAQTEAAVVRLVQGIPRSALRIIVMPHALSPFFATDLVRDEHGVIDTPFYTVGVDTGQIAALSQTEAGEQIAAFYGAVTMAADAQPRSTASITALGGGALTPSDLVAADVSSHDAVMALVDAIESAKSRAPREVLHALASLSLGAGDGLAGPPLSFGTPHALAASSVDLLSSTPQSPNLVRLPNSTEAERLVPLSWFAVPGQ